MGWHPGVDPALLPGAGDALGAEKLLLWQSLCGAAFLGDALCGANSCRGELCPLGQPRRSPPRAHSEGATPHLGECLPPACPGARTCQQQRWHAGTHTAGTLPTARPGQQLRALNVPVCLGTPGTATVAAEALLAPPGEGAVGSGVSCGQQF